MTSGAAVEQKARRGLAVLTLLLAGRAMAGTVTVATIGDSFADAIYLGMKSRPDLVQRDGIVLTRWSRPVIGIARSDYFDYPGWLRDSNLGMADVCFVQIGTNDVQPIQVAGAWVNFGTAPWKEEYGRRIRGVVETLRQSRCRQVLWVLQPGFELRAFLACNRGTINEVQGDALEGTGIWVFRMITGTEAYGADSTHFNRLYVLALGQAAFRLVELHKQLAARDCAVCHRSLPVLSAIAEREVYPLAFLGTERSAAPSIGCAVAAAAPATIARRK
jgi:lysophospholipase L1-like esterase